MSTLADIITGYPSLDQIWLNWLDKAVAPDVPEELVSSAQAEAYALGQIRDMATLFEWPTDTVGIAQHWVANARKATDKAQDFWAVLSTGWESTAFMSLPPDGWIPLAVLWRAKAELAPVADRLANTRLSDAVEDAARDLADDGKRAVSWGPLLLLGLGALWAGSSRRRRA